MKHELFVFAALVLAGVLHGCGPGERAFLEVRVCLNNSDDQSAFVRELESIARSQGARFVDNSAATEKDLDRIGNPNVEKILKRPVINVGMQRDDGVALIATNVGVPDCQVAVGFTDGAKSSDARSFANMVVSKLEHHWRVEPVTP